MKITYTFGEQCPLSPDPRYYGTTQTERCVLDAGHSGCCVSRDSSGTLSGFHYGRENR